MKKSKNPENGTSKCLNCRKFKVCPLIEMSVPLTWFNVTESWSEYEKIERLFLCYECLKNDDGTLGKYLASFLNRKELPAVENDHVIYLKNPVIR